MSPEKDMSALVQRVETPIATRLLASPDAFAELVAVPAGEVDTYGATPLDKAASSEQQFDAKNKFLALTYEAPHHVPLEIAVHVHDTFGRRFDARGEANNDNFITSLMYDRQDELEPEFRLMVEKAKVGKASPAELLLVREVMGIRSVELACLTHPYGVHINTRNGEANILDDEMRPAVELAILSVGGEVYDSPEERYAVKESVGDVIADFDTSLGLLMTRKRTIGVLPDGTEVRERSSFILRTDEKSYLPDEIRAMIDAVEKNDPEWREKIAQNQALLTYTSQLLKGNHFQYAIPISTTAYAYNSKTADLVSYHSLQKDLEHYANFSSETKDHGMNDIMDDSIVALHAQEQAEIEKRRQRIDTLFHQAMPIYIGKTIKRLEEL